RKNRPSLLNKRSVSGGRPAPRNMVAGRSATGTLGIHDRSDPPSVRHRARRPARRRAALAAGLRRVAPTGEPAARPGEARPDVAGDGAGPRGVPAPGGRGGGPAVEQPPPFLR